MEGHPARSKGPSIRALAKLGPTQDERTVPPCDHSPILNFGSRMAASLTTHTTRPQSDLELRPAHGGFLEAESHERAAGVVQQPASNAASIARPWAFAS